MFQRNQDLLLMNSLATSLPWTSNETIWIVFSSEYLFPTTFMWAAGGTCPGVIINKGAEYFASKWLVDKDSGSKSNWEAIRGKGCF